VNPYLKRQREKFDALKTSVEGLQTRAAGENRDLSEDELKTMRAQKAEADKLADEIKDLAGLETRAAEVAAADAALERTSKRTTDGKRGGGAKPAGKDDVDAEEVYTRSAAYGFFSDHFRATRLGDTEAAARLADHAALAKESEKYLQLRGVTSATGAGMVAPIWLPDLYAGTLHKRLRVARRLRQVPFAGPTAWTLGVSGTPAGTETQTTEGTNATESNPTATVITVTPKAISGFTDVSRQLLESGNPAADAILWSDMVGDFYDDAEAEVIAAIEAQASVNTVTIADGAVIPGARNGVLDAIAAVSDNGGGDPTLFAGRTARWTQYLKLADTTNRPLIISQRYEAVNAIGRGDATQGFQQTVQGSLEALDVATSATIAANRGFVINGDELIFSISEPDRFTYNEVVGPAEVRVGVWGYCVIITGRRPKAITKITYTAN